jgi:UDP-N-acetyl-D-glucosamine dehydrogenase
MKVSIIGQGYVGLTISAFAGEFYEVVGFDNNQKIVDQLNQGISHIEGVESSVLKNGLSRGAIALQQRCRHCNGSDIVDHCGSNATHQVTAKPDLNFLLMRHARQ